MTRTDKLWLAALHFGAAALIAILLFTLGGCSASLAKGYEITKVAIDDAYGHAVRECDSRAVKCVAEGVKRPEDCAPLVTCKRWMHGLTRGRNLAGTAFATANETMHELRRAGVIE